jgi:hypothetical protein
VPEISERRFFQLALSLPLAVPALLYVLAAVVDTFAPTLADELDRSTLVSATAFLVIGAGLLGGLPYLVFAALLLLYLREKPMVAWHEASLYAPFVFTIPLFIGGLLLPTGVEEVRARLGIAVVLGLMAIPFGLFYVALAYALRAVGIALGAIERERLPPATSS